MNRTILFLAVFFFSAVAQAQEAKLIIEPNTTLNKGESKGDWNGDNGCFFMQNDGNFVFYLKGKPKWSTGTVGTGADRAVMQGDGNFVVYKGSQAVWSSRSAGNPGFKLAYYHRMGFWGTPKHGIALWSEGYGPLSGPSRFWDEEM